MKDCNKKKAKNLLNKLETMYINYYDSVNNGYNCNTGGNGYLHSEETRKKISIANKNPSEEKRENYRKSKIGFIPFEAITKTKKCIYQFSKDGLFINEFESVALAARTLNISRTGISNNLNNHSKTCGGFIFKIKEKEVKNG